jgi:hypothetical protein
MKVKGGYYAKTASEESPAGKKGPRVIVATPMVKLSKKAEVVIMGSGFEPGQKVTILFATTDGMRTDVGYALKPEPVANKTGAWVTTWKCGRFVSKKLVKGEAYTITATDSDYNFLAHAPVAFYAEKKSKQKPKKK